MIPGGVADKLGNNYEAMWLSLCFLDVLSGKSKWLKFEGIDPSFQGFEFCVANEGTTEWHQTKINAPGVHWTIRALESEDVLAAFAKRLSAGDEHRCVFVSQDNTTDLRTLTEKARFTNGSGEFEATLPEGQKIPLDQLTKIWGCNVDQAYQWLKRCEIRTLPESEIEKLILLRSELIFDTRPSSVFPIIRKILESNFNKTIDTDTARILVKSTESLGLKDWTLVTTLRHILKSETQAYLQTYSPFGAGGSTIGRSQTCATIDELLNPQGAQLVLLTGVAGSGKSGIVRGVIQQLEDQEIVHLAFRIDQFLTCDTPQKIGNELTKRNESPVTTLKGISPSGLSVLIIDQVDAISEVSGRGGRVKEAIFRLIDEAKNLGGVKIVIVCRTFDLETDYRLKSLKDASKSKLIEIPLLDWNSDVEPLLHEKGISTQTASPEQRTLLCLPVNLAIFLEIGEQDLSFKSRSALLEKLLLKKQRDISRTHSVAWNLIQPLSSMCSWMSDRQILNAPISILDNYSRASEILVSEGLIVRSRNQMNFFHESFFDYVYARTFSIGSESLEGLLTSTEQHLFRRTQVRQILETLRQVDFVRYIENLRSVLLSERIRFHIKAAISQWLNTVEAPTDNEFEIVKHFDAPDQPFAQLFRNAVLSTSAWFDLLCSIGWLENELNGDSKEREEVILSWLSNIAGQKPVEIAQILRSWWAGKSEHAERLVDWFGYVRRQKPDEALISLCEDIIRSSPNNLFGSVNGRDRMMMLFHTWGENNSAHSGKLLRAIFDMWFATHPGQIPFEREEFKQIDSHSLKLIAEKTPAAFLEGVTDALLRSVDLVIAEGEKGKYWHTLRIGQFSDHMQGFDLFIALYREALVKVAQIEPQFASAILDNFLSILSNTESEKHLCIVHLCLGAIAANPSKFAELLDKVSKSSSVFEAGYLGAEWQSFAVAYRASWPFLSTDEKLQLEGRILKYTPELNHAVQISRIINTEANGKYSWKPRDSTYYLRRSGFKQWCILSTVGSTNLTMAGKRLLQELERKFLSEQVEKPRSMEFLGVGSPIKRANCEKMSDRQWLRAIERYNNDDERKRGHGFVDGGASQLATELQALTKREPARFGRLALVLPEKAHLTYFSHLLAGLAESQNPEQSLLQAVINRAHSFPERPFGSEIARLFEAHPEIAEDDSALDIILWYAINGSANENEDVDLHNTERETTTINTLIQRGGALHIRGLNGARGWTWESIGSILWKVPKSKEKIWPALESAARLEPLISVRCCMMKALTPLFNDDKVRFESALRQLISPTTLGITSTLESIELSPLITDSGVNLFPYMNHWLPALAKELIDLLLASKNETHCLIGAWLTFGQSFRNPDYEALADSLGESSDAHRRLLADVASKVLTWAENRTRVEIILRRNFNDPDNEVRSQAADVFRSILPNEIRLHHKLIMDFLNSSAYEDHGFAVLHMLESANCDVLDLVLVASQKLVDDIATKGGQFSRRGTDMHQLQDLLKKEYNSSESRPKARSQILDIIDLMLSKQVYGVDSIVSAHER